MNIQIEEIKQQIFGICGTPREVISHYLSIHRTAKKLGFKKIRRGQYAYGRFSIWSKITKVDSEFWALHVNVSGPQQKHIKRLSEITRAKVLMINRYGKLCRIPIQNWDHNRPNHSLSRM